MNDAVDHDVIVIGGGIVGLATAVGLSRQGVKNVAVYEKARKLHPLGAAIGLFPNGLSALEAISPAVHEKVQDSCVPNHRAIIKDLSGNVLTDRDYSETTVITPTYLVWYLLQQYLKEDLEESVVHLGHEFESYAVNEETGVVTVSSRNRSNNEILQKTCRILVGADGIKSSVRTRLVGEERELRYHGKMMFRAAMNLSEIEKGVCPVAGVSVGYQGDEKGKLFAFRETAPGILTFTSMAVFEKPDEIHIAQAKKERLQKMFEGYPGDVRQILDRVSADAIYENAVYDIQVEEQWSRGPVVILGDAAHAMTPGLGQGANQGLEDACELANVLSMVLLGGKDIPEALEGFWRLRIERVKQVHSASQNRSAQINQSDKNSKLNFQRASGDAFREKLYSWQPSFAKVAHAQGT